MSSSVEVEVRPDYDGEDRKISLDMTLELDICIWKVLPESDRFFPHCIPHRQVLRSVVSSLLTILTGVLLSGHNIAKTVLFLR